MPAFPLGPDMVLAPRDERAPIFVLGEPGRVIWKGLATGGDPAATLAADFGIDRVSADAAVAEAVAAWRRAGLIGARRAAAKRSVAPLALPPTARRRIYALCGVPIEVRFAARGVEALIAPRFGWSERADALPVARLVLGRTRNGFVLAQPGAAPLLAQSAVEMSGIFTRRFVEISYGRSEWLAVLHAAAVGDERGAVLLPGANGAGKSTLTAALLERDWSYFSDDCVPIDTGGRVLPVPFALSRKERTAAGRLRLRHTAPPRALPPPAAPRLIVFPRFRTGAPPRRQRLTPTEALERLIAGRAWLSRRPQHLSQMLRLVETTPAWAISYGSIHDALALFETIDTADGPGAAS